MTLLLPRPLLATVIDQFSRSRPRPSTFLIPTSAAVEIRAGFKFKYLPDRELKPVPKFENVGIPSRPKLPILPRTPSVWQQGTMRPPRQTKEIWRMRGEETIHNELKLGQFAIVALTGGMLKHKHFEAMRLYVGRKTAKNNDIFAMYRVDPPYKPITNRGQGKRMGGGKGPISEYGTPIKAGRVIMEVAGKVLWEEVQPWLNELTKKMPFKALALNADMLRELNAEDKRLVETNKNPYSFEYLIRNNMFDCQRQLSPYDKIWFGNFCYLDRDLNIKWKLVTKERYKGKY